MIIFRWFFSATVRQALALRKHVWRILNAQRDLLPAEAIVSVNAAVNALNETLAQKHTGKIRVKMEELEFAANKWLKPYPNAAWRENVEVLLVALAVAMAIRTFFLQPFKIPTGSMQPTLFGVNASPDYSQVVGELDYIARNGLTLNADQQAQLDAAMGKLDQLKNAIVIPSGFNRIKEWFEGNSYVHFVAPTDGRVGTIFPVQKFLIFNLCQSFMFAGEKQTLWFPPDFGESDLSHRAGLVPGRFFHKGENVINLRVSAGDHLFVDRLTYNFHRPERGDIIVFETAGIPAEMRQQYRIPGDQFYIKRLVGLPGEKVSIGDDRHLRINGRRLDASTPHFERLYGFDPQSPPRPSAFSGHLNGTVAQANHLMDLPEFPDEQTVYDVPAGDCLPMGDNTCNSLDSRFWGAIPEKYVIGKAFFVYWPLTWRFGTEATY